MRLYTVTEPAAARFYMERILPQVGGLLGVMMEMDEAGFLLRTTATGTPMRTGA